MSHHFDNQLVSRRSRKIPEGIAAELLVIGLLSTLLMLGLVHELLPGVALPILGLGAFFVMLCLGGWAATRRDIRPRSGVLLWGVAAFVAIVWIAAGQIIEPETFGRWLAP